MDEVKLEGKVWEKFVEFFRYEKGYEDWTEQEIEYSRNNDDITKFLEWLVGQVGTKDAPEYAQMVKKVEGVFELFGVDKNIIKEKLDNGDVSQTEFDYALEELRGVKE